MNVQHLSHRGCHFADLNAFFESAKCTVDLATEGLDTILCERCPPSEVCSPDGSVTGTGSDTLSRTPDSGTPHDFSSGSADEEPQICFDFTKGMCTRGDKCKFSHDLATIVKYNSREKGICFDYLRNQCHRGLLCRFSHDLSNIASQCQVFQGAAACSKTRATSICYDFVKGVCQRGTDCRYSHDLSLIARTARAGGPAAAALQSTDVCYDFLRGRCSRGTSCKYSHNMSLLNAGDLAGLQPPALAGLGGLLHPLGAGGLPGALLGHPAAAAAARPVEGSCAAGAPPLCNWPSAKRSS